jgi:hypothetical protein
VIDLDTSHLTAPTMAGAELNVLPWRLIWRLFASITRYMNLFEFHHPNVPIKQPDNLPETAKMGSKKDNFGATILGGVRGTMNYEDMQDLFSGSDPDDTESKAMTNLLNPMAWVDPGKFDLDSLIHPPSLEQMSSSDLSVVTKSFSEEMPAKTSRLPTLSGLGKRSNKSRKTRLFQGSSTLKSKHKPSSDDVSEHSVHDEELEEPQALRMDIPRLRKGFLSIFVSLLSGYREFIKIKADEEDDEDFGFFDSQAFLAESDDPKRVNQTEFFIESLTFFSEIR